jgi:phosphatidylinositol 4-kinase A
LLEPNLIAQIYLAMNQSVPASDAVELGASVAAQFGKAIGPLQRQLSASDDHMGQLHCSETPRPESLSSLSSWKSDRAKVLTSQIASKSYFAGQTTGLHLARCEGELIFSL